MVQDPLNIIKISTFLEKMVCDPRVSAKGQGLGHM